MSNTATKKVENTVNQGVDSTKQFVEKAAEKTKEQAGNVAETTKEAVSSVVQGAENMTKAAVNAADNATAAAGSGMQSLAEGVRSHTPNKGMLGEAGNKIAETLESGGKYLQDQKLSGMAEDVTEMIKRNPIPAMLIGVGIGYLLAQATSRN